MCGFAGIMTMGREGDLRVPLGRMLTVLSHRGPDGSGMEFFDGPDDCRIGLAHARLAILDVSDAGRQPMTSPDRRLSVAFNGEIYNHRSIREALGTHRWRSGTDTETMLAAWEKDGEESVNRFRGMFAFAMADLSKGRVWLVRDRLGIKPLYVSHPNPGTWLFASEIRSILASGLVDRRVNRKAIAGYLAMGSVAPPWTIADGIESLGPGEIWRLDPSEKTIAVSRRRYWQPPFLHRSQRPPCTAEAAPGHIGPVLQDAAELRLLSDRPVGVFLSGGIDSSAIVQAVTQSHPEIRTFSVAFGEQEFDESRHAEAVATAFGTRHETLLLTGNETLSRFDDALAAYDSPSFDGLNTWFISKAVRDAGITVALSGLGGDELFAGYGYHSLMRRFERPWVGGMARLAAAILSRSGPSSARWEKFRAVAVADDRLGRYLGMRQLMSGRVRRQLFDDLPFPALLPETTTEQLVSETRQLDAVNGFSLLDLRLYMQNTLLRDTDQMSMAHALEVRVPLIDHELVAAVAALPGAWKLGGHAGSPAKGLLLRSLSRSLPPAAVGRKKMGFVLPWSRWLREELRSTIEAIALDRISAEVSGLRPDAVAETVDRFQRGDPTVRTADILCLASLLTWVRRHVIEAPSRDVRSFHAARVASATRN